MLFETRECLVAGVDNVVVRNALIESFCIWTCPGMASEKKAIGDS